MGALVHPASADRRFEGLRFAVLCACGLLGLLFVIAVPAHYDQIVSLRDLPTGIDSAEVRANLAASSLSPGFYAGYLVAMQVAYAVVCLALAFVLLRRGSHQGMTLFVGVLLVLLGTTFWNTIGALETYDEVWGWLGSALGVMSKLSLFLLLYVFPDGRFVPGWTRRAAGALAVGLVVELTLAETPYAVGNWPVPVFLLFLGALLLSGVHAQVHRYRHVSGPTARQQAKWVVAGITAGFTGFLLVILVGEVLWGVVDPGTPGELVGVTLITAAMLLIPASIATAVLRYRLFDIDLIVNRALVYTLLTAGVVGIYVVVVGYLGTVFRAGSSLAVSLVATGLVAVAFAPLRDLVQRGVNKVMYGERDDPYAVLSRLGTRLEATLAPDDVLPVALTTVAEALRLPYAAVEVDRDGQTATLAATGEPTPALVGLPLSHRGEPAGRLLLARRSGEAEFSTADRRLLDDLVRQIGTAVHTLGLAEHARTLAEDLQHSRERLVTAREEERRRLRRDLHDGLGPQLASMTMHAEAARDLVGPQPDQASKVLGGLVRLAHEAVQDVRRVVDELRPPALDALGLVGALRSASLDQQAGGMRVLVVAPDELPPLPAAVEVAAYRIAQEAVSNAARHASADRCEVRIEPVADVLEVAVTDNGVGLGSSPRPGVGLGSMRERAEELGGSLALGPAPGGGTQILARLPLGDES